MAYRLGADFVAELRFLSSEEGGRQRPVESGYKASHHLGLDGTNDAMHHYTGKDIVHPGETVVAELTLMVPELQIGRLYPGMEFTVVEGPKIIATGRINRVLDPRLEVQS